MSGAEGVLAQRTLASGVVAREVLGQEHQATPVSFVASWVKVGRGGRETEGARLARIITGDRVPQKVAPTRRTAAEVEHEDLQGSRVSAVDVIGVGSAHS
jgi:hypothetical protein